jgi:hypothetical protein
MAGRSLTPVASLEVGSLLSLEVGSLSSLEVGSLYGIAPRHQTDKATA